MDAKRIAMAAIEHSLFCDHEIFREYYDGPNDYCQQVFGYTLKEVEEALECKFDFGTKYITYKCKTCGEVIGFYEDEFDLLGEEELWGHIQMHHEDKFEKVQNWETPDMIEECYEEEI